MILSKSTLLTLLPIAAVVDATDFNYEVIDSKLGTTRVDSPASFTIEWRNLWTNGNTRSLLKHHGLTIPSHNHII